MRKPRDGVPRYETGRIGPFAFGMGNNGYLYHSDQSIPPQVSWELYREG
ncbi:MAG: hypothetical protein JJU00_18705 [Opitutales bacterium]|nr:hypothetical protein [Opitutales bacterium]